MLKFNAYDYRHFNGSCVRYGNMLYKVSLWLLFSCYLFELFIFYSSEIKENEKKNPSI